MIGNYWDKKIQKFIKKKKKWRLRERKKWLYNWYVIKKSLWLFDKTCLKISEYIHN